MPSLVTTPCARAVCSDVQLLAQSLELAKEAVRTEPASSHAWFSLGNAQLSQHGRARADTQVACLYPYPDLAEEGVWCSGFWIVN